MGCFRDDLTQLRREMPGWEFHAALQGSLKRLRAEEPPPREANSLWCNPLGATAWCVELLLEEREGADWIFRRCTRVRCPAASLALGDRAGARYLRPEIQLLYKAKTSRPKDEADLAVLLPAVSSDARGWLSSALGEWEPGHPWISRIDCGVF